MVFTTVTVYDGERWDQVANRAYGDATLMRMIIDANPTVGITDKLEGGTILVVPVINGQPATTNSSDVAPWKR